MELSQISLKYFSCYEKFIFSVNRKRIFYGLTTKYVTKLLHWKIFQQITVRIQKKITRSRNHCLPLGLFTVNFLRDCHVWRHAHECACICFRRAFSFSLLTPWVLLRSLVGLDRAREPRMASNEPCTIREEYGIVWNECNIFPKIYFLICFE